MQTDLPGPGQDVQDAASRDAEELLERLSQPWSLKVFLRGWMKADILARIAIVVALAVIPIWTLAQYESKVVEDSAARLKAHDGRPDMVAANPKAFANEGAVAKLANEYRDLYVLTEGYIKGGRDLGLINTTTVGLLVVLAALAVIGEYRRSRALSRLRDAVSVVRAELTETRKRLRVRP